MNLYYYGHPIFPSGSLVYTHTHINYEFLWRGDWKGLSFDYVGLCVCVCVFGLEGEVSRVVVRKKEGN